MQLDKRDELADIVLRIQMCIERIERMNERSDLK